MAALVTESLHPVMHPIRMQNREYTKKALLRFSLKLLSSIGRHTKKPAKWVPDTASRCEQHDILKSRLISLEISDLSPTQTAAAKALEAASKPLVTAFMAFFLNLKNIFPSLPAKLSGNPALPAISKLSQVTTYKMPCFLRYPR